jgi:hypothetical protein
MPAGEACPICGARLRPSFVLPGLRVRRCPACGHRVADHDRPGGADADYHRQYEEGAFLESLRATRERQAGLLVAAIRRHVSQPGAILDLGAGRGFFLEACRREGLAPLAGADTSERAVDELRRSGIEAHLLGDDPDPATPLGSLARGLSFPPRVVTLLDVIEHFPPWRVAAFLSSLLTELGARLELLVVKVPVADGLLYRIARLLAAAGVRGPLAQLYQVGTWPPHRSYFSVRSMTVLLTRVGLEAVARLDDLDFEPELLAARTKRAHSSAAPLLGLSGRALAAAARIAGRFDAATCLARQRVVRDHPS